MRNVSWQIFEYYKDIGVWGGGWDAFVKRGWKFLGSEKNEIETDCRRFLTWKRESENSIVQQRRALTVSDQSSSEKYVGNV